MQGQQIVHLRPGPKFGKDVLIHSLPPYQTQNFSENQQLGASAWTINEEPAVVRALIDFDLTQFDFTTIIDSATLHLYAWPDTTGLGMHSDSDGPNHFHLHRIQSDWTENQVTWNTEPFFNPFEVLFVEGTDTTNTDYILDVTDNVQDMINNPEDNHGWLLKLATEEYHRRINFCSSDHIDSTLRPMLRIVLDATNHLGVHTRINAPIYPNPSASHVNVGVESLLQLDVFDLSGRLLELNPTAIQDKMLDVSSWPSGQYLFKITPSTNEVIYQHFLKL